MKCIVDISVQHSDRMRRGNGIAVVEISAVVNGETRVSGPHMVEVEGETANTLAVRAVAEALKRFTKPRQEILIRMNHPYVMANWQYLERWQNEGYRGRNGKQVKNEQEWRLLWMASRNHSITFEVPE